MPTPETSQDTSRTMEVYEEGDGKIKGTARLVNRMWHGRVSLLTLRNFKMGGGGLDRPWKTV